MPTGSRKKYIIAIIISLAPAYAAAGSIDTERVEETRLQWNNELRSSLELKPYTLDSRLSATAQEWSDVAAQRDVIDHKRVQTDGYYNYSGIENWFLQRGVKFKNVNRATFSESVGYGYYVCKKEECTDELITSIKTTWNFYMKEQPTMGLHYKALVHPYFQTMGLGVTIDQATNRYYLTIHYASAVIALDAGLSVDLPPMPAVKNHTTGKRKMMPIQ